MVANLLTVGLYNQDCGFKEIGQKVKDQGQEDIKSRNTVRQN